MEAAHLSLANQTENNFIILIVLIYCYLAY